MSCMLYMASGVHGGCGERKTCVRDEGQAGTPLPCGAAVFRCAPCTELLKVSAMGSTYDANPFSPTHRSTQARALPLAPPLASMPPKVLWLGMPTLLQVRLRECMHCVCVMFNGQWAHPVPREWLLAVTQLSKHIEKSASPGSIALNWCRVVLTLLIV